jgi:hypothetical protein
MTLGPGCKLRLDCPKCGTKCEAAIPAHEQDPTQKVRFHIRCPECREVLDPLTIANVLISTGPAGPAAPPALAVNPSAALSVADTPKPAQPKRKAAEPPAGTDANLRAPKAARPTPGLLDSAAQGAGGPVEHSAEAVRILKSSGGFPRPKKTRSGFIPKACARQQPLQPRSASASSSTQKRSLMSASTSSSTEKRPVPPMTQTSSASSLSEAPPAVELSMGEDELTCCSAAANLPMDVDSMRHIPPKEGGEGSNGPQRSVNGKSAKSKAAVKGGSAALGAVRKVPGAPRRSSGGAGGRGRGRGGRAGSGGGARSSLLPPTLSTQSSQAQSMGEARGGTLSDNLDEFEIQEASERIDATRAQTGGLSLALRPPRYSVVWSPRDLPGRSSCDEAFEWAEAWAARRGSESRFSPCWRAGDEVEVAWKGKGFEGAWAEADILSRDDAMHVMVRFRQFVDENGSALVERMHVARLRLRPATRVAGWVPAVGDKVEGEWNDCWWEGTIRELHALKGVLFEYERYTNWMWLPVRAVRFRPPLWSYYPHRAPSTEARGDGRELPAMIPEGACGTLGCRMPNQHMGLCSVAPKVRGSRRANLQEKAVVQQQQVYAMPYVVGAG